ncbi:MAG: DUF402 domain-containing protein [Dehalococcoidia bacterium]|nr:DUF402 domain-containing protein [Dehalococcoidia bacterium]
MAGGRYPTDDAGGAPSRWRPGDTVVLRYITRDGKPGMCWPYTVVEDRDDLVALYIPRGAVYKRWGQDAAGIRALVDTPWRSDTLRLMFPGVGHSVWLFWDVNEAGRRFSTYYVNMEEPFRRTSMGFDTNDHMLDIVVTPDLRWQWKDEDVMADRVRQGVYPRDFADAVRAEGERVVEAIEARRSPFSDGWERWAPDPAWTAPRLIEGWDALPATLWERREWAYGAIAR